MADTPPLAKAPVNPAPGQAAETKPPVEAAKGKAGKGETVTVACKLPSGLIVTHGGQTRKFNGWHADGSAAGFGMTHDVDAAWFAEWSSEHGSEFPPLANGLIFMASTPERAVDQARERAGIVAGFEGADPDKPADDVTKADFAKG